MPPKKIRFVCKNLGKKLKQIIITKLKEFLNFFGSTFHKAGQFNSSRI